MLAATVLHNYLAAISDAAGVYDNPDSDDNCEMLPLREQRNWCNVPVIKIVGVPNVVKLTYYRGIQAFHYDCM